MGLNNIIPSINLDQIDGGTPTFEETVITAIDALSDYIGWLECFIEDVADRPETVAAYKEHIDWAQRVLEDVLGWEIDPFLGGTIKPGR